MSKIKQIPVVVESGHKYKNTHGTVAIKDGIRSGLITEGNTSNKLAKPPWLRVRISQSEAYERVNQLVKQHGLATVCAEAKCPNISECWSHGTATFMLMGEICTRACRFCSVDTGNPKGWLDSDEPDNIVHSITVMALRYVVLTSVNRDDLVDGGAGHFASTIAKIKQKHPRIKVEALTPDFQGHFSSVKTIIDAGVDVFAQNVETVERLTHPVRDPRAGYQQTLDLLAKAKHYSPTTITKTSLMLGLGETEPELIACMQDLRTQHVDVLTLGQYLQPTKHHLPIARFVTPEEFANYRRIGLDLGFMEVAAGPMVRSSYRADRIFTDSNLGLDTR